MQVKAIEHMLDVQFRNMLLGNCSTVIYYDMVIHLLHSILQNNARLHTSNSSVLSRWPELMPITIYVRALGKGPAMTPSLISVYYGRALRKGVAMLRPPEKWTLQWPLSV